MEGMQAAMHTCSKCPALPREGAASGVVTLQKCQQTLHVCSSHFLHLLALPVYLEGWHGGYATLACNALHKQLVMR